GNGCCGSPSTTSRRFGDGAARPTARTRQGGGGWGSATASADGCPSAARDGTHPHGGMVVRIAMVGLGRMGGNMTQRLIEQGHEVVVYDRNPDTVAAAEKEGALGATELSDVIGK